MHLIVLKHMLGFSAGLLFLNGVSVFSCHVKRIFLLPLLFSVLEGYFDLKKLLHKIRFGDFRFMITSVYF